MMIVWTMIMIADDDEIDFVDNNDNSDNDDDVKELLHNARKTNQKLANFHASLPFFFLLLFCITLSIYDDLFLPFSKQIEHHDNIFFVVHLSFSRDMLFTHAYVYCLFFFISKEV
ncbi:uncharacterized protein BX664DRAFT_329134 [Halteromyces radiatus]|uniref:uncharacterized protein n=1 Tax=Halteromyces radiatus TaxID=101107 RepID=UPI00221E86D9|nr:uncharacterized protein BX664DRAFT_329134 [Halteromyces radiatus]KAI8093198.1 hypothetical protein BX664DRAFT_329134 [Halteromyces radiatus]